MAQEALLSIKAAPKGKTLKGIVEALSKQPSPVAKGEESFSHAIKLQSEKMLESKEGKSLTGSKEKEPSRSLLLAAGESKVQQNENTQLAMIRAHQAVSSMKTLSKTPQEEKPTLGKLLELSDTPLKLPKLLEAAKREVGLQKITVEKVPEEPTIKAPKAKRAVAPQTAALQPEAPKPETAVTKTDTAQKAESKKPKESIGSLAQVLRQSVEQKETPQKPTEQKQMSVAEAKTTAVVAPRDKEQLLQSQQPKEPSAKVSKSAVQSVEPQSAKESKEVEKKKPQLPEQPIQSKPKTAESIAPAEQKEQKIESEQTTKVLFAQGEKAPTKEQPQKTLQPVAQTTQSQMQASQQPLSQVALQPQSQNIQTVQSGIQQSVAVAQSDLPKRTTLSGLLQGAQKGDKSEKASKEGDAQLKAEPLSVQLAERVAQKEMINVDLATKAIPIEKKSLENSAATVQNQLFAQTGEVTKEVAQKIAQARVTLSRFSDELKEVIDNYKPPLMKLTMELKPENLGSMEVTMISRGNQLIMQMNGSQETMSMFMQHSQDFKNQLTTLGFTGLQMNFNFSERPQQRDSISARVRERRVESYKEVGDRWDGLSISSMELKIDKPKYA